MSADNDVFDLEMFDGVFDDSGRTEIGWMQDVGDISVDEHVTGFQAEEGGLGASRVGASDPQNFGVLAVGKSREEVRVFLSGLGCPLLVLTQNSREFVWRIHIVSARERRHHGRVCGCCRGRENRREKSRGISLGMMVMTGSKGLGRLMSNSRGSAMMTTTLELSDGTTKTVGFGNQPCDTHGQRQGQ